MIVVKIVSMNKAGRLPNFCIYSNDHISSAIEFIKNNSFQAKEVWLCVSDVSEVGNNLGGRITYPQGCKLIPSFLEIVWYASPRKIEEFHSKESSYPFLGAHKDIGSMKYTIDRIHIPEKFFTENMHKKMVDDAQWVLGALNRRKEAIETLIYILQGAGANEVSIEYKISSGRFSIIDWDTEMEMGY